MNFSTLLLWWSLLEWLIGFFTTDLFSMGLRFANKRQSYAIQALLSYSQVWQYYLLPEEEQHMPGVKNPMCNTFPRIGQIICSSLFIFSFLSSSASCTYWRWGSGGSQENINAICILALNIINDKVQSNYVHYIYVNIFWLTFSKTHWYKTFSLSRFSSSCGGGFFWSPLLASFVFSTEESSVGNCCSKFVIKLS